MSTLITNSRAFCWRNWDSDEDEETSILYDDFDSDQEEAAASGRFWINGSDSDGDDGALVIYPGVDHEYLSYTHDHLRDFSRSAIEQFNRDTGNRYEFVQLVEASVLPLDKADFIVVTFQARQSDDDPMVKTLFKAETHSASKSLSHSYHIETVVPYLQSYTPILIRPKPRSCNFFIFQVGVFYILPTTNVSFTLILSPYTI